MHALSLSSRLRKIILAVAASPTVACGGIDSGDAGPGDGSAIDTGLPGCNAEWIDGGTIVCGSREVQLSGDLSKCDLTSDSGAVPTSTCEAICSQSFCTFNGNTNIVLCGGVCIGRLPACLRNEQLPARKARESAVGDYLARAAYLEAAAVDAFAILAAELHAHGAPASLKRAARRAKADEVRHARDVGRLARSYGATVRAPFVGPPEVRPLSQVAVENAVEGCVRETFGALIAAWQAQHARDPRVRASMQRIARDEARHAALGWRIFDWANERLPDEDRLRVEQAMMLAVSDLEAAARTKPDGDVVRALGIPPASTASALATALFDGISMSRATDDLP
jgi:hypothetical protein